ncbi:MAG TPA: hypothetical protein VF121_08200, partial [Thermoanaerobaculia bacterium]|nr:hypothetical protein [Thermoanaerobaculia bacterium]
RKSVTQPTASGALIEVPLIRASCTGCERTARRAAMAAALARAFRRAAPEELTPAEEAGYTARPRAGDPGSIAQR